MTNRPLSIQPHDMSDPFDRLPPHNLEAEMCAIASMMLSPEMAQELSTRLNPDSFYLTDHKIVFSVLRDLSNAGKSIDAVIIRDELANRGQLDAIGGSAYVAQLLSSVPSSHHGIEYASRVIETAALRTIITLSDDLIRRAYAREDSAEIINQAQAILTSAVMSTRSANVQSIGEILLKAAREIRHPETRDRVPTGLRDIDVHTGGIGPSEFWVLGARPNMGKSTIGRQIAIMMAMRGYPTLLISTEDADVKIGRNVLSWLTQTDNSRLKHGDVKQHELDIIDAKAFEMKSCPFHVVNGVNRADQVRAITLQYVARHGVKVVIVDYLQKVRAGGNGDFEQATNSCKALCDLPHNQGVRMIALAQLSRAVANREGNRPQMTDVRSTGQIEQDADVLALLHREDYYHKGEPGYQPSNEAEVILEKQRDGPAGISVFLEACLRYQCFQDREIPVGNLYSQGGDL